MSRAQAVFRALPPVELSRIDRTMAELRARNLTFSAIAVVLELYEGLDVNEGQVRNRMRSTGTALSNPRRRNSIRAMRQVQARRSGLSTIDRAAA